jgi:hypothetical protein
MAATTNTFSGGLKVEFIDNSSSQYDEYADRIKFSLKTRTDKQKVSLRSSSRRRRRDNPYI